MRAARWVGSSPTNAQPVQHSAVTLGIFPLEILDQPPPLADQHEQAPPRMMVLGVLLEVLRGSVDALAQDSDLNLRGPRVPLVRLELLDQVLLLLGGQRHWWASWQSPRPGAGPPGRVQKALQHRKITQSTTARARRPEPIRSSGKPRRTRARRASGGHSGAQNPDINDQAGRGPARLNEQAGRAPARRRPRSAVGGRRPTRTSSPP